jgi:hypothetical protein
MKKALLLLVLIGCISSMTAQNKFYIDVCISPKNFVEDGVDAIVDLGNGKENSVGYLKVGDRFRFQSSMDVINYFATNGWGLSHIVELDVGLFNNAVLKTFFGTTSDAKFPHYILEKEAQTVEEAVKGIEVVGLEEMKKLKKEQKREKARERNQSRTDDMYY